MLVARRRTELECCDGVARALRDLVLTVKRQLQPLNTGHWLRGCGVGVSGGGGVGVAPLDRVETNEKCSK